MAKPISGVRLGPSSMEGIVVRPSPYIDLISQEPLCGQVEKIAASTKAPEPIEMTWQGVATLLIEQPITSRPLLAVLEPYLPMLDSHALWQFWRAAAYADLPEWKDALWIASGGNKDPTEVAIGTLRDTENDQLCPEVYVHIHSRLGRITAWGARRLSQALAYRAIHQAFRGPWMGSGKLFETILEREDPTEFELDVQGKTGNWFLALGAVVDTIVETPHSKSSATIVNWQMAKQMETLLDTGLTADRDYELTCGKALAKGLLASHSSFSPLLESWIHSGGDWRRLREIVHPQVREWIDQQSWTRKQRLTEVASRLRKDLQNEDRDRPLM